MSPLRLLSLILLLSLTSLAAQAREWRITAPDGVELAVQEQGDPRGVPLIFIHGLLGSRLNWEAQLTSAELSRFRLITYDLRGHGRSGKPVGAAPYSEPTLGRRPGGGHRRHRCPPPRAGGLVTGRHGDLQLPGLAW